MIQETKIAGFNTVVYKPDSIKGKIPLMIFLPGLGEQVGTVLELYTQGPLKFVKAGFSPNMIIVGFQTQQQWPNDVSVKKFLDDMSFPELSGIILTGLSAGAGAIYDYINDHPTNNISAIIPMSMDSGGRINPSEYTGIKVWGFCGKGDSRYLNMKKEIGSIPGARFTDIPTTVKHGDWNKVYDPAFKEGGENIYDWAAKQVGSIPDVPPPVDPKPKKLIATVKVFDDGSIEKI